MKKCWICRRPSTYRVETPYDDTFLCSEEHLREFALIRLKAGLNTRVHRIPAPH